MSYGYIFYFDDGSDLLTFPITPGELTIKRGSNNEVVTLINEGDINILKSPSLIEVEFEARFPMRKYPYSRPFYDFETYLNKFRELKNEKRSFRFIVARKTPANKQLWGTNILVALEDFEINENADEGDDVLITFQLREYKAYGVKTLPKSFLKKDKPVSTSTSNENREGDNGSSKAKPYTIQSGDCLWNIAKAAYGDGSKWRVIYDANKSIIESTANKYRNGKGSSNGHWIYPDTKIVIPDKDDASSLSVQKLSNSKKNNKLAGVTGVKV